MSNNVLDSNRLRQVFFIIIIFLLGILLSWQLYSFLPALLGAITLYILMHKAMLYLTEKKKWGKGWTTILLMLVSFIVILLPVGLLINMLSSQVSYALQHSSQLVDALKKVVADAEGQLNIEILSEQNINKLGDFIATSLPGIVGATFNSITTIFFMLCQTVLDYILKF